MVVQPLALGQGSTFNSTVGSTLLGAGRIWFYNSTHIITDVGTSDFISDGQALGMRPGDVVFASNISAGASALHLHVVRTVGSTFVSCSAGLTVSSAS